MKNRRIIGVLTASIFFLMLVMGSTVMAGNDCPHAKSCVGDKAACQKACGQKTPEQCAKACGGDKSKCTAQCKTDGKCTPQGAACCPQAKDSKDCCPSKTADAKCCPKQTDEASTSKPKADPGK